MKRTITLLMATVWMGCATLFAANQNIKELGESKYLIEVGDLSMVVNAATGGKILSFKYKDQEIISQLNRPEQFGSTFWTSPQKEWNWPPVQEYDKRPYKAELKDDKLVLTSEVSSRLGFRIGKEFTVDAKRKAIVVTYSIKNESNQTKKVLSAVGDYWNLSPSMSIPMLSSPIRGYVTNLVKSSLSSIQIVKKGSGMSWTARPIT